MRSSLVVRVVGVSIPSVVTVFYQVVGFNGGAGVVDLFRLQSRPIPRFGQGRFHRVTPRAICPFFHPRGRSVRRLHPYVKGQVGVRNATIRVVGAVVRLSHLVPIILSKANARTVVPHSFHQGFAVFGVFLLDARLRARDLPQCVVRVVVEVRDFQDVIFLPRIFRVYRLNVQVVLTNRVVECRVSSCFRSNFVHPSSRQFRFFRAIERVVNRIQICVVVVFSHVEQTNVPLCSYHVISSCLMDHVVDVHYVFSRSNVPSVNNSRLLGLKRDGQHGIQGLSCSIFGFASVLRRK